MKVVNLLFAFFLIIVNGFGQNHLSVLTQKIHTLKNQATPFQKISPFKKDQAFDPAGKQAGVLADGVLLTLDIQTLKPLLQEKKDALLLEIPAADNKTLSLELVRHELLTDDFKVVTSGPEDAQSDYHPGIYYRGIVKDQPNTLAAISIFENEIMGVISTSEEGNRVLGKIGEGKSTDYILYKEKDLLVSPDFNCETDEPEVTPDFIEILKKGHTDPVKSVANCVRTFLECENDMFVEKGSVEATVDYMTGLFNVVATLYQNENINTEISEIFVWNTPDSYATTSTIDAFNSFLNGRPVYNGDIAMLVSRGDPTGGGIAGVNLLCTGLAHSYSYIASSYEGVPTYSWSVHVVTHEMGHVMGSQHTHDCVWNGNSTAIDNCSSSGCGGEIPNAGTIMSYCQGVSTLGVDFSLGFGPQPGDLIRFRVAEATCLTSCVPELSVSTDVAGIQCYGDATGSISLQLEGGAGPFTYVWSTGDTSNSINNLAAGIYSVTVLDANGTETILSDTLTQPDELLLSATVSDETFPGSTDGAVEVSITGGTAPYLTNWSNGYNTENASGLGEGHYYATITDAVGCEKVDSFYIRALNCLAIINNFPYFEGFENTFELGTQNTDDDFDWTIHSGSTHSKQTGPENAFDGTYYLYTESTGKNNKTAVITSHCIDLSTLTDPYLNFAYHMYGNQMGLLRMEISEDYGNSWTPVWFRSGNQGDTWNLSSISLAAYSGNAIQIQFAGTMGGNRSDMAIDDIRVTDGEVLPLVSSTSIEDDPVSGLVVYPNPAKEQLFMSMESLERQTGTIRIANLAGKVIREGEVAFQKGKNDIPINLKEVHKGIYFLTVVLKNGQVSMAKVAVIR